MRFRSPVAFAALLLFSAAIAVAGTPQDSVMQAVNDREAFVVAVLPDQLPLAVRDPAGNLQGFDIEVAEALAKRLGHPVRFVTPGWSNILAADSTQPWDFAVASITPTPQREKILNFPALYRMDAAVVVVRSADTKFERPQDVSGKTIAVKAKTTFERYLRKDLSLDEGGGVIAYVIENAKVTPVASNGDALKAVVNKKAEAAVTLLAVAEAAKKDGMPIRVLGGFLYFEPVSVATQKGDPAFDQQVADAVESLRQDGTLSALSTKWFGIDLGSVIP